MAKQFMEENGINWWTVWPSESPDINPIEMVWNQMKRNIARSELKSSVPKWNLYSFDPSSNFFIFS
jgi:transposase